MLNINYKYREPATAPITVARFLLDASDVEITVGLSVASLSIDSRAVVFDGVEWEQFTTLITAVNKQINGEGQ